MEAESKTYKGHEISIQYDQNPENPRDWDNLCEMHYHSNRYLFGDTNWGSDEEGYNAMIREAKKQGDVVLPLYAYVHSGTALSVGTSFYGRLPQGHDVYDSWQCGVVILRRKKMLEEYGGKRFTKKLKERVIGYAVNEVQTFQQYLNGEVYGYVIDEHGDSCWGYYTVEDAIQEAEGIIDWIVEKETKSHFEQLKTWIKNKVPLYVRTTLSEALAV